MGSCRRSCRRSGVWARRLRCRKELSEMSKSPLLTGEDPEGAAGLQALMSLRTSLSPTLHAVDEAWEKREGVRRRKW